MKLLKPFIATALTLWVLAYFLPNITFSHPVTVVIAALVIVFLNAFVRPVLKILFLPVNIVTLGLFSVVIHVGLLWLATYLVPGFVISNLSLFGVEFNYFMSLLLVSVFLGFVQGLLGLVL